MTRDARSSVPAAAPLSVGDWIEEPAIDGGPPRRGLVLEVLGHGRHRHYRVRWDEQHESLHFASREARRRTAAPTQPAAARRST